MEGTNTSVRGILEQLSTEELRALLDKELHTEPVNDDAVRLILSLLRERSREIPVQIPPQTQLAWEKYQRDTDKLWEDSRKNRRIRCWTGRAAAAAAVLAVLLVPIIPREAGAENLWQTLSRWTEQIVEFFGPNDNDDRIVEYTFHTDNTGLQQVYDTAVELGITVPVVPMWLPEGYELTECKIEEYPAKTKMYSRFVADESELVLIFEQYQTEVSRMYQKDASSAKVYEYSGVRYQIMQNNSKLVAYWTKETIECSLSMDCQEDTLTRILKSIYDTEDE